MRSIIKFLFILTLATNFHCNKLLWDPPGEDNNWHIYETSHLVIHVRPQSSEEYHIGEIKDSVESWYQKIVTALEVEYNQAIYSYIYSSKEDMKQHLGVSPNGRASPITGSIYLSYWPTAGHEMIHVIAFWGIGQAGTAMASEGLATAIPVPGGYHSKDVNGEASQLFKENKLPGILAMVNNWGDYPEEIKYPAAGSFIDYLIDNYGINLLKQFYREATPDDFEKVTQTIYGKSLAPLENDWHQFLESYGESN